MMEKLVAIVDMMLDVDRVVGLPEGDIEYPEERPVAAVDDRIEPEKGWGIGDVILEAYGGLETGTVLGPAEVAAAMIEDEVVATMTVVPLIVVIVLIPELSVIVLAELLFSIGDTGAERAVADDNVGPMEEAIGDCDAEAETSDDRNVDAPPVLPGVVKANRDDGASIDVAVVVLVLL